MDVAINVDVEYDVILGMAASFRLGFLSPTEARQFSVVFFPALPRGAQQKRAVQFS